MKTTDSTTARHPHSKCIEVDRVTAQITPEHFVNRYYLPQIPVIIQGVVRDWPAARLWTPEFLLASLDDPAAEREYCFDLEHGHRLTRQCETPTFLSAVWTRTTVATRARAMRLWISRRGTHTRWHYDGNSLHVANVQVRGRKRFHLISPDTPLTCFAFSHGARAGYTPIFEIDTCIHFAVCDITAGDMIFIPQHWSHYVVSLDEDNINVNWVWTDTELLKQSASPAAIRERECVAVMYLLERGLRILGRSSPSSMYLESYGGSKDFELARGIFKSLPVTAVLRRCLVELSRMRTDRRYRRRMQEQELAVNEGIRRNAYDYFHKTGSVSQGL
jgi:cupin-like protein